MPEVVKFFRNKLMERCGAWAMSPIAHARTWATRRWFSLSQASLMPALRSKRLASCSSFCCRISSSRRANSRACSAFSNCSQARLMSDTFLLSNGTYGFWLFARSLCWIVKSSTSRLPFSANFGGFSAFLEKRKGSWDKQSAKNESPVEISWRDYARSLASLYSRDKKRRSVLTRYSHKSQSERASFHTWLRFRSATPSGTRKTREGDLRHTPEASRDRDNRSQATCCRTWHDNHKLNISTKGDPSSLVMRETFVFC